MKRSQRMGFLSKLASEREQTAARELGQKQLMLRQAEQQFEQLVDYREDYSRQFCNSARGVMQGAALSGYRAFLSGLNQAIEDQGRKIRQHEAECEASVQRWNQTKSKSHALEKVTDSFRRQEEQHAAKHEQREIDDLVSKFRH